MGENRGEEVTIRAATPADAAGIARVHVDSWRTTYPGIVPDDYLARMSYKSREQFWGRVLSHQSERYDRVIAYVATTTAGEIIGFASTQLPAAPEEPADLNTIYLVQAWQRRCIGTRLVIEIVRQLIAAGQHSLLVWVAMNNQGGRRFYEALGGQLAESRQVTFGELTLDEVAYRWPDLASLERATSDHGS